jgi:hypothetical protein
MQGEKLQDGIFLRLSPKGEVDHFSYKVALCGCLSWMGIILLYHGILSTSVPGSMQFLQEVVPV